MDIKDTIKNTREKLELPVESAMPCKVQKPLLGETCGDPTAADQSFYGISRVYKKAFGNSYAKRS